MHDHSCVDCQSAAYSKSAWLAPLLARDATKACRSRGAQGVARAAQLDCPCRVQPPSEGATWPAAGSCMPRAKTCAKVAAPAGPHMGYAGRGPCCNTPSNTSACNIWKTGTPAVDTCLASPLCLPHITDRQPGLAMHCISGLRLSPCTADHCPPPSEHNSYTRPP